MERKRQKTHRVEASASKLDEVAEWKDWVAVCGIYIKGLRDLSYYWHLLALVIGVAVGHSGPN